jgi:predicted ATP-grasp superfamily ATP-dependent carboligase
MSLASERKGVVGLVLEEMMKTTVPGAALLADSTSTRAE